MSVVVINYGVGNLGSVLRAFEECGADVFVSESPQDLFGASHIVLPGVGSFHEGMHRLQSGGWASAIKDCTREKKIPLLGICLGMQLLFERGHEGGETIGLGLLAGEIGPLALQEGERTPHVGWNEVWPTSQHSILDGIAPGTDFYFVHSYACRPKSEESIVAETPYAGRFASVVCEGSIFGTQFHPEKSSKAGFTLIKNFLRI